MMDSISPKRLSDILRASILVLLLGMLFFMPYSTFIIQVFQHSFEAAGHPLAPILIKITTGWKEVILGLAGLLFIALWLISRKFPFKMTRFDWYLVGFAAIGTIIGGIIAHKTSRIIFGFRYDFSVFLFYFLARSVRVSRQQLLGAMKVIVYLAIPIALFGLLQVFVLPMHFMERFGYSWDPKATGNPLPPYHLVGGGSIIRALTTFPGPNSTAMYAVSLVLLLWQLGTYWFKPTVARVLMVLMFVLLVLTFSRGHLLSLFFSAAIVMAYGYLAAKGHVAKGWAMLSVVTISLLFATLGVTIYLGTVQGSQDSKFQSLLLHDASSAIHRDVRLEAWDSIKTHPFGTGLGTSGLATTNTGEKIFNPESWYVQITQELGWLGLVLALGLIILTLKVFTVLESDLHDQEDRKLLFFFFAAFLAIVFSANFLPSWFEVASLSWWVLFGFFFSDYLVSFPRDARDFPIQKSA